MLYCSGGRISEIIGQDGIKPIQITEEEANDNEGKKRIIVYINNVITLKKRSLNLLDDIRLIPVTHDKHYVLLKAIKDYITIEKINDNEVIFPFNRSRADKIIKKNTKHINPLGLFAHYFRHLRANHLIKYSNFTPFDLKQFFNWTDIRPANSYEHLFIKDVAKKMV